MTLPDRSAPRYTIVPRDGIDTLHRDSSEACNLDDTDREEQVDEATAIRMKLDGKAKLCAHCFDEAPT